jgi:hypothetical protein
MTDEIKDSGQSEEGNEQPSSSSSSEGDKRSSGSAQSKQVDLGERMERLEKMLSSFQSGKDRAIAGTKDELAELKVQFGEVQKLMKNKGLSEDEAFDVLKAQKEDAEYRNALLEVRDLLKTGKSLPAQAGVVMADPSVVEMLKNYPQLDANDPDVVAKVLSIGNAKDAELAALQMIYKRTTAQPPSPTAAGSLEGHPATPPDQDALVARLSELQKNPTKNWKEIGELEKKLGW